MNPNKYLNDIIQGNTLSVLKTLPDEFVDVGVTSPPYNKGENKKGWLVKNVKYSSATDKLPEDLYQKNQMEVLNEIFRITKPEGSFFYNHKLRWERGVRFVPYGSYPNFCFAKTSFMLGKLYEMADAIIKS